MPRIPRLQLTSDFRTAVLNDSRGVVRLAHEIGLTSYTALSRLLYSARVPGTALNQTRLRHLASVVGFTGEVFRG